MQYYVSPISWPFMCDRMKMLWKIIADVLYSHNWMKYICLRKFEVGKNGTKDPI